MISEVLRAFLSQHIPETYRDEIAAEIEKTGTVSRETLNKAGIKKKSSLEFITNQISELAPKKSLTELNRGELQNILSGQPVDEAGLTDTGLETRRNLFEQLGGTKENISGFPSQIKDALESKLSAYQVPENVRHRVSPVIQEFIMQNGRYPAADELRQAFRDYSASHGEGNAGLGSLAENYAPLANFINDQNARNELSGLVESLTKAPDTSEDISRLENLLSSRKTQAARESDIQNFISDIPNQLAEPTNQRINLLRELGDRQFDYLAPQIMARENAVRQGAETGALGDVLASTYGDIQSRVESEAARLANENDAFYFNAAYQNQIRKLMEGRTDLNASLNVERKNIITGLENRFQQGQFDLNSNLQNDILMQKYANQIQSAQAMRQRQQDLLNQKNRAGTIGALGGIVGGVAGGIAGIPSGPAGIAIGGTVGSSIGSGLSLLFGQR